MKLTSIIQGWKDFLLHKHDYKVDPKLEQIAKRKIGICSTCSHNKKSENVIVKLAETTIDVPDDYCDMCGCNIYAKAFAYNSRCPKGYWLTKQTSNGSSDK